MTDLSGRQWGGGHGEGVWSGWNKACYRDANTHVKIKGDDECQNIWGCETEQDDVTLGIHSV